jgi:hypothetical protein
MKNYEFKVGQTFFFRGVNYKIDSIEKRHGDNTYKEHSIFLKGINSGKTILINKNYAEANWYKFVKNVEDLWQGILNE